MPIPDPRTPSTGDSPSPEEVIVVAAFRRRALAITERCLPTIIREARYEELEELIAVIRWFGSPEAMRLEAAEDYCRVPGLSLEEVNALIRLRMKRGGRYAPLGDPEPETRPPAPGLAKRPGVPTLG